MGRVAGSSRAEVWRGRLRQQRRSGLAVAEFCRREKISPASFYAWRKRLSGGRSRPPGQPQFVPIEVATVEGPPRGVQIELPGGAVVALPVEASAELVATAIHAAMQHAGAAEEGRPC